MNAPASAPSRDKRRRARGSQGPGFSLYANGEPMLWVTGGTLAICLVMILSMLGYVFWMGSGTFWPLSINSVTMIDGKRFLGEVTRDSQYVPGDSLYDGLSPEQVATIRSRLEATDGLANRRLFRTGNFELTQTRFHWLTDAAIVEESQPEWAMVLERMVNGRFYGILSGFVLDGELVTDDPAKAWTLYEEHHGPSRSRFHQRKRIETVEIGAVNRGGESSRQNLNIAKRRHRDGSIDAAELERIRAADALVQAEVQAGVDELRARIAAINQENHRYAIRLVTADGVSKDIVLAEIAIGYPANRLGTASRIGIYLERWWEFIFDDPREANTEGGVWPAIIGTITMTLMMTIFVVPIGVLAALYLREYAKPGPLVSSVRIAINNLAGVPSIVFGVFGLGFFCYIVGGGIDWLFYEGREGPTFGKGGVLWAAATLALLTLPVVIVATEEALAAVPGSMRQGSYACGASKWQTIRRIVLPRAMPGIMTGAILAMARGAGEVAPLMLVGAVKLAPSLPLDLNNWNGSLGFLWTGPVHLERSFLHLGFQIYDVGFQSPDSEAARPMVFTTTMLLIGIIVVLNFSAMFLRARLKRRFAGSAF